MGDPFGERCIDAGGERLGRIVCWHHCVIADGVWVLWDGTGHPRWYPLRAIELLPPAPSPPSLPDALLAALPPPRA